MVSVKLMLLPLQKNKKKAKMFWLPSILQSQSEQVRDRNNDKATHIRYCTAGHRTVSNGGLDLFRMSGNKTNGMKHAANRKRSLKPGNIPSTKNEHETKNSSGLVGFLCVDPFASRQLLCYS